MSGAFVMRGGWKGPVAGEERHRPTDQTAPRKRTIWPDVMRAD
ncbi:hypothetical protein FHW96_002351 [Novosphingobium sp. SG751A]|nr:hypothetical protein [Novosphingobium sp. SG751A]NOW46193.1 hypothetical protein [Novosphingobium sp. SG751A]